MTLIFNGDLNCDPGFKSSQHLIKKNGHGLTSLKGFSKDEYTFHMHTNDWVTKQPLELTK